MVVLWFFITVLFFVLLYLCRTEKAKAPQFLRCNRSCQRFLFRALWDAGFYPDVCYRVGTHELDLAFPYSKVAVECGWNEWEFNDIVRFRSKKKVRELKEQGWQIICLSPEEIYGQSKETVQKISLAVSKIEHIF